MEQIRFQERSRRDSRLTTLNALDVVQQTWSGAPQGDRVLGYIRLRDFYDGVMMVAYFSYAQELTGV